MSKPQRTPEQELIAAARRGQVAPLKKLLKKGGVKLNAQDDEKNLKLWSDGILHGSNWQDVKPKPWQKGPQGNTALMWALQLHRAQAAEALLDAGADPRVRNVLNESALHLVTDATAHLIDRMVAAGGDVNAPNEWGATPLMIAIYLGQVEAARKLMEHGALLSHKTPGGLDAKTLLERSDIIAPEDVIGLLASEDVANYVHRLRTHDWYYFYSDDNRVYNAGSESSKRLSIAQKDCDPDYELWNKYAPADQKHVDQVLTGHLTAFSETGSEGHHWAFEEDGKQGYDGLHFLDDGDILTVFNDAAQKKSIWKGKVNLDHKKDVQPLPTCPSLSGQWVKNIGTVHGLQRDIAPEKWAKMFLDEKPAQLIVRHTPKKP